MIKDILLASSSCRIWWPRSRIAFSLSHLLNLDSSWKSLFAWLEVMIRIDRLTTPWWRTSCWHPYHPGIDGQGQPWPFHCAKTALSLVILNGYIRMGMVRGQVDGGLEVTWVWVVVVVLNRRVYVPLSGSDLTHCSSNDFWSQNQQRAVAHLLLSPCSWPMISAIGGIRRNLLRSPGSQFAGVLLMRPIFLRSLSIAGHSHHRCIGSSSSSKHSLHSYAMPGSIRDLCFAK